jgi:glycopeptide antibiotics resistance protein
MTAAQSWQGLWRLLMFKNRVFTIRVTTIRVSTIMVLTITKSQLVFDWKFSDPVN